MFFNTTEEQAIQAASQVRLLLLDVDGILTDGRLYFSNSGEESKAFNTLDGHGIKMLMSVGIAVGIITGRKSDLVTKRAADLGIEILYQGREDKMNALNEILASSDYALEQIAYAGDDLPDLPVLKKAGIGFSVPLAHIELKTAATAVTNANGGMGAVREITDFILKSQNKYAHFLAD